MQTEILLTIKLHQQLFVDPKRVRLLKEIQQCGSINQAAKNANVSYKSAWDHLEAMNNISPRPLLERNTGGKNGGGTALTHYAERLLQLYDLLEQTQQKAFAILQDEHIPLDSLLTATAKFAPQSSARNQFFGKVEALTQHAGKCDVEVNFAEFSGKLTACITEASRLRLNLSVGKEVMLMIKAPWLKVHSEKPELTNCLNAEIRQIQDKNGNQEITLALSPELDCYATQSANDEFHLGQQVWVSVDPEQIVLLTL